MPATPATTTSDSLLRRLALLLAAVAALYMAMACLRTVGDFDTGWQLALGRYLIQHHAVPRTDVLSYTSAGTPWTYPALAGAVLYAIYSVGGYAALSWLCALAGLGLSCWLLLRRAGAQLLATAAILAVAVPSLAYRLTPRADLFTTLLFAILFTELWRRHRGLKAWMWLVPIIMLAWVNLHGGFIAGVAAIVGYVLCEALALTSSSQRGQVLGRLHEDAKWLLMGVAVTVINPFGINIYAAALHMARATGGGGDTTLRQVGELSSVPLGWHMLRQVFELRDPDSGYLWLLALCAAALLTALWRRQWGAGILLLAAGLASLQRLRYQGLFAIVVVVVAAPLLADLAEAIGTHRKAGLKTLLSVALAGVLLAVCGLRVADLESNRYYLVSASASNFGAGEGWWFPERAANFIKREKLLGNIFQPYNLGGFAALALGPEYPDYVDGRGVSEAIGLEEQQLLTQSPDAPQWTAVADQRGINVLLLSAARVAGLEHFNLPAYCRSQQWQPVYLDEVSIVLLRRTAQNQPWLDRLHVDCSTAKLTPPDGGNRAAQYNFLANSGAVYYYLSRDREAEAAWQQAMQIEPGDPNLYLYLAQLYQHGDPARAEQEMRTSLRLRENSAAWYALGRMLAGERRYPEAEDAIRRAIALSYAPANQYKALAQVELRLNNPTEAEQNFLRAEKSGPAASDLSPNGREFHAQVAEGRAEIYRQRNDLAQAVSLQQEAVRQTPQVASRWKKLSELAAQTNQTELATQAAAKSEELTAPAEALTAPAQPQH